MLRVFHLFVCCVQRIGLWMHLYIKIYVNNSLIKIKKYTFTGSFGNHLIITIAALARQFGKFHTEKELECTNHMIIREIDAIHGGYFFVNLSHWTRICPVQNIAVDQIKMLLDWRLPNNLHFWNTMVHCVIQLLSTCNECGYLLSTYGERFVFASGIFVQ